MMMMMMMIVVVVIIIIIIIKIMTMITNPRGLEISRLMCGGEQLIASWPDRVSCVLVGILFSDGVTTKILPGGNLKTQKEIP